MTRPILSAGTISLTNGSATVTGSGTAFGGDVSGINAAANATAIASALLIVPGTAPYVAVVDSAASDTELTLTANWSGGTVSGAAFNIVPLGDTFNVAASQQLLRQILDFLGATQGFFTAGDGVPASGLGDDGDVYLDVNAPFTLYFKDVGAWTAKGDVQNSVDLSAATALVSQITNIAGFVEGLRDEVRDMVGQKNWDGIDPVNYLAQLHTNDSIGLVIRKDTDYLLTGLEARHPWGHLDPLNAAMPTVANLVSINPVSGGGAFMVRDRADHSRNSYDSIAKAQTKTLLTDNGSNKIDIPIASLPNFVNGEFTIFVDVAAHSVPGADAYIFDFCDDTGNAFSKRVALRLQSSGNMIFDAYDTAAVRAFQSFAGISGAAFKLAVRCKGGDWKYSLNGGAATTLATNGAMPTGLVKFRIAQNEAGTNAFAGTINNISIEPAVGLSDADLVAMTS